MPLADRYSAKPDSQWTSWGWIKTRGGANLRALRSGRSTIQPSALGRVLFPPEPRHFPGQRWVNIAMRSVHLVGVAGIGGGFLFDLNRAAWEIYWLLTLASGVALSLLYLWSTCAWIIELKGLAIVVKTALLGLALAVPEARGELFVLIIAISGMIAHAPARVRGYRWSAVLDPHERRRLP